MLPSPAINVFLDISLVLCQFFLQGLVASMSSGSGFCLFVFMSVCFLIQQSHYVAQASHPPPSLPGAGRCSCVLVHLR